MMRQYELVERVLKYDPKADEGLLNKAYVYAMKAHGNQKRKSGDPYFSHPLEVAAILTELKLDDATIATALLHDTIEDTDATRAEIDQLFGPRIGQLVDGLTKIKRLDLVSKKAEQAENFRKLLLAISSDIRVLLVKLADRLHNMRTLEHNTPESRERNSQETLDVYAPLAGRMGMQGVREELEAHAFRWLHPTAHRAVADKLEALRKTTSGLIEETRAALVAKLAEANITAEVTGREKSAYSIWEKIVQKRTSLEKLSDIYAFRIVVETESECYRALGIAHSTWQAVPGRFKDYISVPKRNNYQSIHTTVIGPRNQRVELQIRTRRMHETAEYGVAAHALYKDARGKVAPGTPTSPGTSLLPDKDTSPYGWLRRMVETLIVGENAEEFLEHTKLELFRDQVFCFTPKGRLIALPRGATPLDFAYAVHTDVGAIANGAVINGRQVPIETKLRNGDEVEVLTSKGHTHPAAWESFVVTGRAQLAVRRSARDAERKRYIELGRRLLAAQFERSGQDLPDDLRKLPIRFNQKSVEDVLAAVGRYEIPIPEAVAAIEPDPKAPDAKAQEAAGSKAYRPRKSPERGVGEDGWVNLNGAISLKFRTAETAVTGEAEGPPTPGIPIRGLKNDVPVSFEPGGALPGERIIGVLTAGEGIRVFQIHSPRLKEFEHERWIDVTWDIDPQKLERFPATIDVVALNEPGTLAQVATLIGHAGGNIDKLNMIERASDFTTMRLCLGVYDLAHLTHIISGLRAQTVVNEVERVFE
jgi:GTP diphosphokinase / guanosine-3',5'-bis(diphosphate) 3'-diphosphatase